EDGIRDRTVTGVQTCALPIYAGANQTETVVPGPVAKLGFTSGAQSVVAGNCSAYVVVELEDAFGNPTMSAIAQAVALSASPASRSEERRVGKGCGDAVGGGAV